MRGSKYKSGVWIFTTVTILIFAQVGWWAKVFVDEVSTIAELRTSNLQLERKGEAPAFALDAIRREASRRRWMFLSESAFFVFITCIGLCVLFRALRAERRSRAIQRDFIDIISHESKTPITALKLRLESILEKRSHEAGLNRDLSLALDEVRRLASAFDKTMSLNRMEREGLSFASVSLGETVREVARRLDFFFRAKNVTLELDLEPEVLVNGDSAGLCNTVQSLLENAVLYNSKAHRLVSVTVKNKHGAGFLSVWDDGPGIPAVERSKIFERFYRGSTGKSVAGTGLGLYLAKTIVEAHRGTLRLAPPSPAGGGARFEMELPSA